MTIDNSFYVKNNYFQVQNYKYQLKKNLNFLNIDSEFEIIGNFSFPNYLLEIKHELIGQKIEKNYLKKSNKNCWSAFSPYLNCYVFTNNSFISLKQDENFSKIISSPISFNIETTFDFNNDVLQELKNNHINLFSHKNNEFIKNVQKTKIENKFDFQNTYSFKRNKNEFGHKNFSLIKEIIIEKDKPNKNIDEKIEVFLPNYDNSEKKYIDIWFEITKNQNKNIFIENLNQYILLNTKLNQQKISFSTPTEWTTNNELLLLKSKKNIFKNEINGRWEESFGFNNGFYVDEKSSGYLNLDFLISTDNQKYLFQLSNFFEFNQSEKEDEAVFIYRDEKFNHEIFESNTWEVVDF